MTWRMNTLMFLKFILKGHHQIPRTIDILMERSKLLFSNNEKDLALDIFTEVLELSPGVLEALEYRAECYFSTVRNKFPFNF